jgi:predicted Zn-dependent peptidase
MIRWAAAALCAAVTAVGSLAAEAQQAIPAHPSQLRFPPLDFAIPNPAALRHQLGNGVVVYIAEDHSVPLVEVTVQARIGAFLDTPDKDGLAALTGNLLRQGGTLSKSALELDDALDALAAAIEVKTEDTRSSVTLSGLSAHLDAGLALLFDLLAHPAFNDERVEAEKARWGALLASRNDAPEDISDREWQWLLYGESHVSSRYLTAKRLAGLKRQDLIDFHARYWQPANFFLTVAGDVEPAKVLARLDALFGAWHGQGQPAPWPPAPSTHRPRAGMYVVPFEAPQDQVTIGRLGLTWDEHWRDSDPYAIEVLTEILAGNLFTSRLGRRLRGEDGLVYGIDSRSGIGATWPDSLQIRFSCDPARLLRALVDVDEELKRIRDEPVSADELATAKAVLAAELTASFASARATVVTFALDDLLGLPHERWQGYRNRLNAVSAAEVQRIARTYLRPEEMVRLVVGSWPPAGPAAGQQLGAYHLLPLRDPVNLELPKGNSGPGGSPGTGH